MMANLYSSMDAGQQKVFREWTLGLLHDGIVTINFKKQDGTERVMKATLKPGLVPVVESSKRKPNVECQVVWDTEIGEWRSFKWMNLTGLHFVIGE